MQRYIAPPLSAPEIVRASIPSGYAGTRRTADQMIVLIRAGAGDFYVRQKAIDVLLDARVRPKDYRGEMRALFEWVQRNVRYTKDPFRVEVLHSARRMLELRAGDCDDMAVLLGAMLESIGHPVRLVLTGPDPLRPDLFSHVYVEANHRGRWIPLDATTSRPFGWEPRMPTKLVIPLERRSAMAQHTAGSNGMGQAAQAPDYVRGVVRGIARDGIAARDPRVKQLWDVLRQRQLLNRDAWVKRVLRRVWTRGLGKRQRPVAARRLRAALRSFGILPPRAAGATSGTTVVGPLTTNVLVRPVRPVRVRRVGRVRRVRGRGPSRSHRRR